MLEMSSNDLDRIASGHRQSLETRLFINSVETLACSDIGYSTFLLVFEKGFVGVKSVVLPCMQPFSMICCLFAISWLCGSVCVCVYCG